MSSPESFVKIHAGPSEKDPDESLFTLLSSVISIGIFLYTMMRPKSLKLQLEALKNIQFMDGPMTPKIMTCVLQASGGMIPASVVATGRVAVARWIEVNLNIKQRTWFGNLTRLLIILSFIANEIFGLEDHKVYSHIAHIIALLGLGKGARKAIQSVAPPALRGVPKGLRTRGDWVKAFPNILEIVLTDPATGRRRKTVESYRIAKSGSAGSVLVGLKPSVS